VAVKTVVIDVLPALIAPVQHGPRDGGAEGKFRRNRDRRPGGGSSSPSGEAGRHAELERLRS
jgi:hypothetical protein